MAHYVVTTRQLFSSVVATSMFVTASVLVAVAYYCKINDDVPEIQVDRTGMCVQVLNFRNGDGYVCQDRDVTLRKYSIRKQ